MTFPTTPLDVTVELQGIVTAGVWTDITDYVYTRDGGIQIQRGRQDEGSSLQPGAARFSLNNRDGRFSPRNPTGPYYGKIGRNIPMRISTRLGTTRLVCPTNVDGIQAPDSAGLSITGDLDLRVDARIADWTRGDQFITKFSAAGQASYILDTNSDGSLVLFWSPDGTNFLSAGSTVPLPQTTGRQTVRATLDVDNGAAGRTITFYTGTSVDGPWTQLGAPLVQAGVTSIFDSTSLVRGPSTSNAEVYAFKILAGIGGVERANPDFTAQADGATSFVDAAGNTWTVSGAAEITNRRYRFHGEVSSWPQAWDLSGNDVWAPLEAAGVLRRLGQGADALSGPIQRFVLGNSVTAYAYWPLEDESGATSIASGLSGGPAMSISGAPELASDDSTFFASGPLPVMGATSSFSGAVVPFTATGTVQLTFLMHIPAAGATDASVIAWIATTGTAPRWELRYDTAGSGGLTMRAFDSTGAVILSSGAGFVVNGKPLIVEVELVQDGADVDWRIATTGYTDDVGLQWAGTLATRTVGAATNVQIAPGGGFDGSTFGHVMLHAALPGDVESPLRGYAGETAGRRVERLCAEEGITFTAHGDLDQSEPMGAQRPSALLDLFAECQASDMGQVFESRGGLGLAYRTRDSRQYQGAALAMEYGDLSDLVPVEDDQTTRNDVTVSRIGGSSARTTVDTGPLSTQAPPNGVGRYSESLGLSLYADSQTGHQAQWRATEGTVDEARYPEIRARLETRPFATSTSLTDQALDVEHGDLITVSDPPAWLPPDTIQQHTIGQVETLDPFAYGISFVCTPTTPAGATTVYDDTDARYSGEGSYLDAAITSSATEALVAVPEGGPLWTSAPADLPMEVTVGGERLGVSAVSSFATDAFTRVVAAGSWGTADVGGAWTPDAGAADFSVNGTRGVISTAAGNSRTARLLQRTATDVDAYATFDVQQTATGAPMELTLRVRHSGTDRYSVSASFATAGTAFVSMAKNAGGVSTSLGTVLAATAYTPGTGLRLRLRAVGSTIQAKAWMANVGEPDTWGLTVTDTSVTAAGAVSIGHFRDGANTSADPRVYLDNLSVVGPQIFTVTRSANGVVKAQSAGAAIDIDDPDYYSF